MPQDKSAAVFPVSILQFESRYGLPRHRQKEARDKLRMRLASGFVLGRRQKVYTSYEQIDKVLSVFGLFRLQQNSEEVVAKVIRRNPIAN